jgi:hypothetical protein
MIIRKRFTSLLFYFTLLLSVSSCEKFQGDQTVPAWLKVDSVYLTTDYYSQGTASQQITDAWVYIDDEFLGAFELPARFPVLYSGKHTVKIWPGIKRDGIAATRQTYEFYTPITKQMVFQQDSNTSLGVIKTTYQTTTSFTWKEDFDGVAMTLDTTQRSSAYIQLTTAGSPETFEGTHSALIELDSLHDFFECQSHNEYPIPYAPVFLELNFNISNSLTVGVTTYGASTLYQVPVITLNPTGNKWKKIYIDLTTTLNAYTGMQSYRVYLGTFKDGGQKQTRLLLDNFKLVTRK